MWQYAVKQVIAQLGAQISMQTLDAQPCLGVVYVSASYAPNAASMVAMLSKALPQVQHWVGCAGHSVLAGDMDYGHAGALAVMLPYLDAQNYELVSAAAAWQPTHFSPRKVLIHGDAAGPDVAWQVQRLQQQMPSAACMGALCDLRAQHAQWSWGAHPGNHMPASIGGGGGGVQLGGLSGVVFSEQVDCLMVGMQGCKPVGRSSFITRVDQDVVLELDGKPALDVFFHGGDGSDVLSQPHPSADAIWQKLQSTWIAMTPPGSYLSSGCLARDSRVLRVVGIDPLRQGIVLNGIPLQGHALTRCQPDAQAARADMRRACAELWESLTTTPAHAAAPGAVAPRDAAELEPLAPAGRSIAGAIYIRSQQRNPMARSPQVDAELQLIRHALGPVPLLGFSSSCEIDAGQLQHVSAQLLVFTQPLQSLS